MFAKFCYLLFGCGYKKYFGLNRNTNENISSALGLYIYIYRKKEKKNRISERKVLEKKGAKNE